MVTFDKPAVTVPRARTRPPSRPPPETIWTAFDKASKGVAEAHEIVDLLEKDNHIFGRYLASDEYRKGESDDESAGTPLPPVARNRPGLADDGESCFLTGLGIEAPLSPIR